MGYWNFETDNPRENYRKCGSAIKCHLNISHLAKKRHTERKNPVLECLPEWEIEFHVTPNHHVGNPGTVVQEKKIHQLPLLSWLGVRMYLGGTTGMFGHMMKLR